MTVKSRGSILYFSSDSSWAFGVFKGPQLLFTADRCQGWREQRGEGGGGGPGSQLRFAGWPSPFSGSVAGTFDGFLFDT